MPDLQERYLQGRALRRITPRSSHAGWQAPADRPDPLSLLEENNARRLQHLVPYRYGRMLANPFTFLRGAPVVMACDLAGTPNSGIRVQICGDAHLGNIGVFATPERALVLDVNDFDETLPGPWEWDVKRLAASLVVAGRYVGFDDRLNLRAVRRCMASFRQHVARLAEARFLEAWYEKITVQDALQYFDAPARERFLRGLKKVRRRNSLEALPKLARLVDGERLRIHEVPPLIERFDNETSVETLRHAYTHYRESLPDERRVLLDQYRVVDFARKVVGVGSVGTRCGIVLLLGNDMADPLFLQFKQALPSVLAPYCGASVYANQGQRVVVGTRLMQSASDIFLGWTEATHVHTGEHLEYFIRQLRDMKGGLDLDQGLRPEGFLDLARLFGWVLARAHARSGKSPEVAGYLGKSDAFDLAIAEFARDYADQTSRDHAALREAATAGRMEAVEAI